MTVTHYENRNSLPCAWPELLHVVHVFCSRRVWSTALRLTRTRKCISQVESQSSNMSNLFCSCFGLSARSSARYSSAENLANQTAAQSDHHQQETNAQAFSILRNSSTVVKPEQRSSGPSWASQTSDKGCRQDWTQEATRLRTRLIGTHGDFLHRISEGARMVTELSQAALVSIMGTVPSESFLIGAAATHTAHSPPAASSDSQPRWTVLHSHGPAAEALPTGLQLPPLLPQPPGEADADGPTIPGGWLPLPLPLDVSALHAPVVSKAPVGLPPRPPHSPDSAAPPPAAAQPPSPPCRPLLSQLPAGWRHALHDISSACPPPRQQWVAALVPLCLGSLHVGAMVVVVPKRGAGGGGAVVALRTGREGLGCQPPPGGASCRPETGAAQQLGLDGSGDGGLADVGAAVAECCLGPVLPVLEQVCAAAEALAPASSLQDLTSHLTAAVATHLAVDLHVDLAVRVALLPYREAPTGVLFYAGASADRRLSRSGGLSSVAHQQEQQHVVPLYGNNSSAPASQSYSVTLPLMPPQHLTQLPQPAAVHRLGGAGGPMERPPPLLHSGASVPVSSSSLKGTKRFQASIRGEPTSLAVTAPAAAIASATAIGPCAAQDDSSGPMPLPTYNSPYLSATGPTGVGVNWLGGPGGSNLGGLALGRGTAGGSLHGGHYTGSYSGRGATLWRSSTQVTGGMAPPRPTWKAKPFATQSTLLASLLSNKTYGGTPTTLPTGPTTSVVPSSCDSGTYDPSSAPPASAPLATTRSRLPQPPQLRAAVLPDVPGYLQDPCQPNGDIFSIVRRAGVVGGLASLVAVVVDPGGSGIMYGDAPAAMTATVGASSLRRIITPPQTAIGYGSSLGASGCRTRTSVQGLYGATTAPVTGSWLGPHRRNSVAEGELNGDLSEGGMLGPLNGGCTPVLGLYVYSNLVLPYSLLLAVRDRVVSLLKVLAPVALRSLTSGPLMDEWTYLAFQTLGGPLPPPTANTAHRGSVPSAAVSIPTATGPHTTAAASVASAASLAVSSGPGPGPVTCANAVTRTYLHDTNSGMLFTDSTADVTSQMGTRGSVTTSTIVSAPAASPRIGPSGACTALSPPHVPSPLAAPNISRFGSPSNNQPAHPEVAPAPAPPPQPVMPQMAPGFLALLNGSCYAAHSPSQAGPETCDNMVETTAFGLATGAAGLGCSFVTGGTNVGGYLTAGPTLRTAHPCPAPSAALGNAGGGSFDVAMGSAVKAHNAAGSPHPDLRELRVEEDNELEGEWDSGPQHGAPAPAAGTATERSMLCEPRPNPTFANFGSAEVMGHTNTTILTATVSDVGSIEVQQQMETLVTAFSTTLARKRQDTDALGGAHAEDDIRNLRLLRVLGQGGYSVVLLGRLHALPVAVKVILPVDVDESAGGGSSLGNGKQAAAHKAPGAAGGGGDAAGSGAEGGQKDATVDGPVAVGAAAVVRRRSTVGAARRSRLAALLRGARELAVLTAISHPNIVQVYSYCTRVTVVEDPTRLVQLQVAAAGPPASPLCTALIMEYCDMGSLADAIDNGMFAQAAAAATAATLRLNAASATSAAAAADAAPVAGSGASSSSSWSLAASPVMAALSGGPAGGAALCAVYLTLLEVALALRHMHSLGLVHCDVKPANVLLRSSATDPRGFTAKLTDFGFVTLVREDASDGDQGRPDGGDTPAADLEPVGTVTHMAPELIQGGAVMPPADIFSFGILMWEVFTGRAPYASYAENNFMAVPSKVLKEGLRPAFPPYTPRHFKALAETCWSMDASRRPTAPALVARLQELLDASCGNVGAS